MALSDNKIMEMQVGPPRLLERPARADVVFHIGAIVAHRRGSRYVEIPDPDAPRNDLVVLGLCLDDVDTTDFADGDCTIRIDPVILGTFANGSGGEALTADDIDTVAYLLDDETVIKGDRGGTLSPAGIVDCVDDAGRVTLRFDYGQMLYLLAGSATEENISAPSRVVRGVVTSNIASLAAFTVAGNDGLTYTEGQRVLLAGQTTAAQNGVYVVGEVDTGVAPLTRAGDMPAGEDYVPGSVVEVSEGTTWKGSTWKVMATGSPVVGTDDPLYYPKLFTKTVTLAAGVYTIGAGGGSEPLYLLSTTTSSVQITRNTANTSTATTGGYAAPVANRTAGKAGTAAVLVRAEVAAGTLNNADVSTLDVLIQNW